MKIHWHLLRLLSWHSYSVYKSIKYSFKKGREEEKKKLKKKLQRTNFKPECLLVVVEIYDNLDHSTVLRL